MECVRTAAKTGCAEGEGTAASAATAGGTWKERATATCLRMRARIQPEWCGVCDD